MLCLQKVYAAVKSAKSNMPNRSTKVSTYEKLFWDLVNPSPCSTSADY